MLANPLVPVSFATTMYEETNKKTTQEAMKQMKKAFTKCTDNGVG